MDRAYLIAISHLQYVLAESIAISSGLHISVHFNFLKCDEGREGATKEQTVLLPLEADHCVGVTMREDRTFCDFGYERVKVLDVVDNFPHGFNGSIHFRGTSKRHIGMAATHDDEITMIGSAQKGRKLCALVKQYSVGARGPYSETYADEETARPGRTHTLFLARPRTEDPTSET